MTPALAYYRKTAGESLASQNEAGEIKVRAERRAGELLAGMEKAKGTRLSGKDASGAVRRSHDATTEKLSDIGLTKYESSRLQQIAAVPPDKFEGYLAEQKQLERRLNA